jgi:hypothetical protein
LIGSRTGRTIPTLICGLTFAGGGCATVFLLAASHARRRAWIIGAIALIIVTAALAWADTFPNHRIRAPAGVDWPLLVQLSAWTFVGLCLMSMSVQYALRLRTPEALLLALWVLGTFVFATFVSWTVAARFVLPLAPAIAIIAATFPSRAVTAPTPVRQGAAWTAVACGFALALIVALADQSLARTARDAAARSVQTYRTTVNHPREIWFTGHWGFQYYIQQLGGKIIDRGKIAVSLGDGYVIADNNINLFRFPADTTFTLDTFELTPLSFCTTTQLHAFFFSNVRGPLPFAFGHVPPEVYHVEVFKYSMAGR